MKEGVVEMAKSNDFTNEDLYRFIWEALKYGDDLKDKEGKQARFPVGEYITEGNAPTYDEMRNRIIAKSLEDPSYIEAAMDAYNSAMGTDYPYTKFSPKADDQRALNVDAMDIAGVNSFSNRIAQALGYADNEKENGALSELMKKLYMDENGKFVSGGDRHAGVLALLNERLGGNGDQRKALFRALDISPEMTDSDVANYVLPYLERSRKAAKYENMPTKLKLLGSLVAGQSMRSAKEGKNPTATDLGTDVGLNLALAKLVKLAPSLGMGGWSPMALSFGATGMEGGADFIHDLIAAEGNPRVYETGENYRADEGSAGDLLTEEELVNRSKEIVPSLFFATLLGGAGSAAMAGINKGGRLVNRGIDAVKEKTSDAFYKIFGGKSKQDVTNLKRKLTNAKKKEDAALLNKLEEEQRAKVFSTQEGVGPNDAAMLQKKALDAAGAYDLSVAERKAIEEALASGRELPNNLKGKLGRYLQGLGRSAVTGADVLGLKLYDPNTEIDLLNRHRR